MRGMRCALLMCVSVMFGAGISGTWQFTVETNQGTGSPAVTLQQVGDQLTGTFNSQIFGAVKLTGSVRGSAIEFAFDGEANGQKVKVTYKGTIESATTMKGTAVYPGFDDKVTWTATKR